MSFESGSISCRMFYLPQPLPDNALALFRARMVPPLDTLGEGQLHGWVGGRHLLDRTLDESSAFFAGYLRIALMCAEKKIPESLLRAQCRMDEIAHLRASGQAEVDRKTRARIRKENIDRLLPSMPPQLKGMTLVHKPDSPLLFAEAISDSQLEVLQAHFRETLGFNLAPIDPMTAAAHRLHLDLRPLKPSSFSPECDDEDADAGPGRDFLTWLWFFSEARGGLARFPDLGEFGVALDGTLTFFKEGDGAHETVLRHGNPLLSAEAKTALLSGKKLRRASLILARQKESWHVTLDADTFSLRGLKLPEIEKVDAAAHFQERMIALQTLHDALLSFYDRFLKERNAPAAWAKTRTEIHQWVADRATRK